MNGAVAGTMTFKNIETVIPSFTPGTLIAPSQGERRVEDLRAGDRVITRDNGIQEIRWAGAKRVDGDGVQRIETLGVTYVHFMFDHHEAWMLKG